MGTITWRAVGALIAAGTLALPATASAHASVSPPTVAGLATVNCRRK